MYLGKNVPWKYAAVVKTLTYYVPLAQMVEQMILNHKTQGSSP